MMKALDALREVSHEMQLLAHFLRMVSREGGAGAETADSFSRKLLELQRQIEEGLQKDDGSQGQRIRADLTY